MKKVISIFLIAAIGGASSLGVNYLIENKEVRNQESSSERPAFKQPSRLVNFRAESPEMVTDFTKAADMSVHAVVHVKTTYNLPQQQQYYYYDPFRDFLWGDRGNQPQQQPTASGSGVIISPDGYIITNNHVIHHAEKIEVILNNKRTYTAEVVGKDPATDLALLKVKDENLPYLAYGNSDQVKVGEWVLAVGNPFNLTSTVTAGIVSAKGRSINILESDPNKGFYPIEAFIQTDAAVNPGNSGGALVNTTGQLIGINAAIASNTGSYAGYSFAIPVNIVKKVVADLVEFGEVQRAFIGVNIRDLDAKLAKENNLSEISGVYVNGVTAGGSAKEAGMLPGDIITKVGNVEVSNVPQLQEQISRFRPGDKVNVTVKRAGREIEIPVILKNQKGSTELVAREKEQSIAALDAVFETVSEEEKRKLGIEHGLKVVKLEGGKLRSAGIKEGFIITGVDNKKIKTTDDLKNMLSSKKGGVLIEGVYPNGLRAYYGFGL